MQLRDEDFQSRKLDSPTMHRDLRTLAKAWQLGTASAAHCQGCDVRCLLMGGMKKFTRTLHMPNMPLSSLWQLWSCILPHNPVLNDSPVIDFLVVGNVCHCRRVHAPRLATVTLENDDTVRSRVASVHMRTARALPSRSRGACGIGAGSLESSTNYVPTSCLTLYEPEGLKRGKAGG